MKASTYAFLASLVVLGACAWFFGGRAAAGSDTDEAAIRDLNSTFVAAWNKHDTKAMAAVWAEDGDLLNPFGRYASGRSAVEKLLADEHGPSGMMRSSQGEIANQTVRLLTPDVAIADWTFKLSNVEAQTGEKPDPRSVHVTTIYKKTGDSWSVCAARPYNEVPAPAEARATK